MWEKIKEKAKLFYREFKLTEIYSGSTKEDRPWYGSAINFIWKASLIGVLCIYLILLLVSFDNLPSFEQLENPTYNQASLIYANDGSVLGKYYNENREFVPYDSLNPHLIQALLSTEDARYYSHSGVDFFALFRVFFKTVLLRDEDSGGGSTITQQLAKLLFERPNLKGKNALVKSVMMIRVKLKEWLTSFKLERRYTKEEILALYLNKFDFIYEAHGVQTASQTYFGKNQKQLKVDEAATLIGMLKNPTLFNPRKFPDIAKDRRNTVMALMVDKNYLLKKDFDALKSKTMDVSQFKRETHLDGLAPYFRAELGKWLKDLLDSDQMKKSDGTKYNIYEDGLKIFTTIDPVYQQMAEEAAIEHMINVQKSYFNVWKNSDPWTHDADDNQKRIRKDALNNLIRETDRFQAIWSKYYGKLIPKLEAEIGDIDINDRTIQRIVNEENEKGFLKKELQKKIITQAQYDYSILIKNSKIWPQISKLFNSFENEIRSAMTTVVKMKIYNFETQEDKDVEMSPLDSIKYLRKHLQIGSVAVDPHSGEVKAWVGGTNFKYFKYDHVNSRRQVGSTFKPFVYSTAIALQGIHPCNEFQDIQYTIPADDPNFHLPEAWSPGNANESFSGSNYNLYRALRESKNSITVKLVILLGSVDPIRGLLHNMGIDSTAKRKDGGLLIPKFPSIVLGTSELSALEMSGAYTTFANNGVYTKPIFVSRIEDKNGRVIYRSTKVYNVALSPNYNYVMLDLLQKSGSIGSSVKVPTAGKTGTTNDFVDGWYMGITPNLVVGTWVGGEDPWIHFLSLDLGQGSVMARPFFQKFISKLEKNPNSGFDSNVQFIKPPGDIGIDFNCDNFKAQMNSHSMDNSVLPQKSESGEDELFEEEDVKKKNPEEEDQPE
ncbi:MAG TPA: transglycosylase domain-containing protein [Saprospiraceae bacterium]|nr:transglycosylase domain-containing protein [Saprospiraceae bacterium]